MGRHDLFHEKFDEFRGAAHHRFATPLRLNRRQGDGVAWFRQAMVSPGRRVSPSLQ